MNRQVRDGLGGLCFAAVAVIVGFALSRSAQSSDLAVLFYGVGGLVAVVSLVAIGRGVTADDEPS